MASRPRWGQNFLVDQAVARRIVEEAAIDGADVVEIGPGRGALTDLLLPRVRSLVCLEIDPELAEAARARYAGAAKVRVVHTDALAWDWPGMAPRSVTLVSNLPYEAGTAIVLDLLLRVTAVASMTVMLQREVAERMAGEPGSKIWGRLGVLVGMYADVDVSIDVPPSAFRPAPKVDSRVLHLRPLEGPRYPLGSRAVLESLLAAAFAGKRKMLRNNLGRHLVARLGDDGAARVFEAGEVCPTDRPEVVPLASWAAMSLACSRLLGEGGDA